MPVCPHPLFRIDLLRNFSDSKVPLFGISTVIATAYKSARTPSFFCGILDMGNRQYPSFSIVKEHNLIESYTIMLHCIDRDNSESLHSASLVGMSPSPCRASVAPRNVAYARRFVISSGFLFLPGQNLQVEW